MPGKAGRPPGSKNKVGRSEKEFIQHLLDSTQKEYEEYFLTLAKSQDKGQKARFANIRVELSKMIVPKPVEIDATIQSSDFEQLLGLCNKWDDEQ